MILASEGLVTRESAGAGRCTSSMCRCAGVAGLALGEDLLSVLVVPRRRNEVSGDYTNRMCAPLPDPPLFLRSCESSGFRADSPVTASGAFDFCICYYQRARRAGQASGDLESSCIWTSSGAHEPGAIVINSVFYSSARTSLHSEETCHLTGSAVSRSWLNEAGIYVCTHARTLL